MTPNLEPFTTLMDLTAGTLAPDRGTQERRLSDMPGYYLAQPDDGDDPVVYRVHLIPVTAANSEIQCSTTVLEPGRVGDEFFMTKGHFHQVRDRSEIYIGLAGEGRLVMATEDGRHAVEPIRPGTVSYVPGGWAHRSVNVGDDRLVFFAAYVGDAGHDYGTIAQRGLPVMVVAGEEGPQVVTNPRYAA
ncbi:MAG TPA: glucose-6-phosphate isomerase family protein [Euzebyales bacterium]|nr:glucose-6-phosphate isomerase family protein [Euzebyales bacterium]